MEGSYFGLVFDKLSDKKGGTDMAGQEKVELMRKYPVPQTLAEISKCSFIGWKLFTLFTVAIFALTLYFGG